MAEPFIGEIRLFSFNFAPKGWALCNGGTLPIQQNQALFSVLGTFYGGDGRITFGLPDLRGRVALDTGGGFTIGQKGGEEIHTITAGETPTHGHMAMASANGGTLNAPTNNSWAVANTPNVWNVYAGSPTGAMDPGTVQFVGGNQPHENRSPYLVINFCIALQGIFPSQN